MTERVLVTTEAFDEFVNLPENESRRFEFIAGEIVEVPSNPYASKISYNIGLLLGAYVKQHKLGHITGEAGGYEVGGERFAPDVAFVSYEKQAKLDASGYNSVPPDLAVEVEFPTSLQSERRLRAKLFAYLAVGTTVWVVYPETKEIEVYVPGQPVKIYRESETVSGAPLLEGFTLNVKDVFED